MGNGGSRHTLRVHGFTIDMQLPNAITKIGKNSVSAFCPSAPPGSDLKIEDDTLTWENSPLGKNKEYGVAKLKGEGENKIHEHDSWEVIEIEVKPKWKNKKVLWNLGDKLDLDFRGNTLMVFVNNKGKLPEELFGTDVSGYYGEQFLRVNTPSVMEAGTFTKK